MAQVKAATEDAPKLASDVITDDADELFSRKRSHSPYIEDVRASLKDGSARRIVAATKEDAKKVTALLRKAQQQIGGVSMQTKTVDGFVVFKAKAKSAD